MQVFLIFHQFFTMANSYDPVASFYDFLSLVLGKTYRESKYVFLQKLEKGHRVLYIGGGTGENLPEILNRIGESGQIFYVEASGRMIEKAKKRIPSGVKTRVVFLHQSDFAALPSEAFDIVITQYLLDILPDNEINKLCQEISRRTGKNSRWVFVDFFDVAGRRWLIRLMIGFFRIFTGTPRKDLPDYGHYFARYGWKIQERKMIDKGFIQGWLLTGQ